MNPTLCQTLLVCFLATVTLAADKRPKAQGPSPLAQLTEGRKQYVFPSGASLRFAQIKDGALVLSSGRRELHRLPRGTSVSQALKSPDRRTILLLLTESTPLETPKEPDVTMELVGSSGILRIHSDRKEGVACTMHMTDPQIPEALRNMTVAYLDSVLNDGLTVQMQVIRPSDEEGSTSTVVTAEVWDIAAHQRWRVDESYYD